MKKIIPTTSVMGVSLGRKIRLLREINGYKQSFMAEKLGITQNGYSKIESDVTNVSAARLEEIAQIFGISISELTAVNPQYLQQAIIQPQDSSQMIPAICESIHNSNKSLYAQQVKFLENEVAYLKQQIEDKLKIIGLLEEKLWFFR